jgi:hypothetical protein
MLMNAVNYYDDDVVVVMIHTYIPYTYNIYNNINNQLHKKLLKVSRVG